MKRLALLTILFTAVSIFSSSCKKDGITSGKLTVQVDGKSYKNRGIVTANRILGLGITSDIATISTALGAIRNVSVTFSVDSIVEGEEIELYAQDNTGNTIMYTNGSYRDYDHNKMDVGEYLGKLTINEVDNSIGGKVSGVFEAKLKSKKGDYVELTNGEFTAYFMN